MCIIESSCLDEERVQAGAHYALKSLPKVEAGGLSYTALTMSFSALPTSFAHNVMSLVIQPILPAWERKDLDQIRR